jgi:hypothetical protein
VQVWEKVIGPEVAPANPAVAASNTGDDPPAEIVCPLIADSPASATPLIAEILASVTPLILLSAILGHCQVGRIKVKEGDVGCKGKAYRLNLVARS